MYKATKKKGHVSPVTWAYYAKKREYPKGSVGFCGVCMTVYEPSDVVMMHEIDGTFMAKCVTQYHENFDVAQTTMEYLKAKFNLEKI